MTARKRAVVLAAAITLPVAGLLWSGSAGSDEGLETKAQETSAVRPSGGRVIPVEVSPIQFVDHFISQRTFTGVLKPTRTSELAFERTGRVVQVLVREGDRVSEGQPLAQMDVRNLMAQQSDLAAQRAAAASQLEELVAGPRAQTIAAARAELRDWEAQVELALRTVSRRDRLLQQQATSQDEFDQAKWGRDSTIARRDAAASRLEELEEGTRREKIESQRARVAQLDAALELVSIDIEKSTILAPFAGTVASRLLDEGSLAAPGAPLLRLIEDQPLEAWIGLPPPIAEQLSTGETTEVLIDGRRYPARFRTTLPELDLATRTRTAIFDLEDVGVGYPQQVTRIQLNDTTNTDGNTAWVPSDALAPATRGLWSILVVDTDDTGAQVAVRRDVEVMHTRATDALVRGTLQPTDRIIGGGTHRIVAGQRVTAVERTQADARLPQIQ